MRVRAGLFTCLPQDTGTVRTLPVGFLCGLRLTKRLAYYTVILSNAKDLGFRLFTAFYITVEKILHYVLHIIIEKILHCVQNDNEVCKASLRSRRMTMKCARHRSE